MEASTRHGVDEGAAGDLAAPVHPTSPPRAGPLDAAILDFVAESFECIDVAETATIDLEVRPDDESLVALAFRRIHTVKGSAGLLGFAGVNRLADRTESVLELLRDKQLRVDQPVTSAVLQVLDAMRSLLQVIASTGSEPPDGDELLAATVALEPFLPDDAPSPASKPVGRLGDLLVSSGAVDRLAVEIAAARQAQGDERPLGEILVAHGETQRDQIDQLLARQGSVGGHDGTVRVEAAAIDAMFVHATALDVAIERLGGVLLGAGVGERPELARANALAEVRRAAGELTAAVRSTRMRPIGTLWGRLPRIAREAAHQLGKDVMVRPGGRDVLVEARILEAIVGPVIQLLRNAVDHGIESPEDRAAAGKPARGVVELDARRAHGRLLIEIGDDGAGLDLAAIRAKAVERGVIGPTTAATLADETVAQLIFLPGVTTARSINAFSGRGVGMDVVRSEVERAGGDVRVSSTAGQGTRFVLDFPDQLPA